MAEPFRHRLRVRRSECDLQGVVFYSHYLAYLDHTVTELWRAAVGPYTELPHLFVAPDDLSKGQMPDRVRAGLERFMPA